MNNATLELILKRRSLRAFSDKEISPSTLEALKEATLRAPTAGNQIFYSIIEVTDSLVKQKLAELCDNQAMIAKAPLVWVFLADGLRWDNFYNESGSVEKGKEQGVLPRKLGLGDMHLAMQDAIIASQNAVIAAEALGLGSCFIGDIIENHEQVSALLGLKPHTMVASMLIMGYPKTEERTGKQSVRCPNDTVFMENHYNEPHLETLKRAYSVQEQNLRDQNRLPFANEGSIADFYYFRKHMSPFMEEMNRSAKIMIDKWEKGTEE